MNEKEKKQSYNERILSCDQGSSTPVVLVQMVEWHGARVPNLLQKTRDYADRKKEATNRNCIFLVEQNISLMRCVVMCVRDPDLTGLRPKFK